MTWSNTRKGLVISWPQIGIHVGFSQIVARVGFENLDSKLVEPKFQILVLKPGFRAFGEIFGRTQVQQLVPNLDFN